MYLDGVAGSLVVLDLDAGFMMEFTANHEVGFFLDILVVLYFIFMTDDLFDYFGSLSQAVKHKCEGTSYD